MTEPCETETPATRNLSDTDTLQSRFEPGRFELGRFAVRIGDLLQSSICSTPEPDTRESGWAVTQVTAAHTPARVRVSAD